MNFGSFNMGESVPRSTASNEYEEPSLRKLKEIDDFAQEILAKIIDEINISPDKSDQAQ